MPKFLTLIASHLPSTSQLNAVYFERECITCTGNKYIHNNLWQFLFNLIGKINRDSYSSLSLEGKCQYLSEYIVCFKA
jgi:hypothetical protein